jgi:hypothetical protein
VSRNFDFYEYAGFIIPGAVLLLGLLWLFPEQRVLFAKEGVTFGELGLFVIVAYAAGHLVQGVGNFIEWICSKVGGYPTQKLLAGAYLSTEQHKRLDEILRTAFDVAQPSKITPAAARSVAREAYAIVAAAGKAARVDTFNGNFGLLRGLAAAFLVLFVAAIIVGKSIWILVTLAVLFALAVQRMHRFSRHYAIELFVQFLLVKKGQ